MLLLMMILLLMMQLSLTAPYDDAFDVDIFDTDIVDADVAPDNIFQELLLRLRIMIFFCF